MLRVAHDVSDGGLAVALAEAAIAGGVGLEVDLGGLIAQAGRRPDPEAWLFGEGPAGSCSPARRTRWGPSPRPRAVP